VFWCRRHDKEPTSYSSRKSDHRVHARGTARGQRHSENSCGEERERGPKENARVGGTNAIEHALKHLAKRKRRGDSSSKPSKHGSSVLLSDQRDQVPRLRGHGSAHAEFRYSLRDQLREHAVQSHGGEQQRAQAKPRKQHRAEAGVEERFREAIGQKLRSFVSTKLSSAARPAAAVDPLTALRSE
jgi:hypothetical protein